MGRLKFTFLTFILILLLSNVVMALTPEERAYFDTQNQKVIAQISSKIDTQTNRVEQDLKTEVENSRNMIRDELGQEISGSLKAVAIGLAGLIIVTLAIFKVIDLKITATRNMQKYERELTMRTDEVNKLIQDVQNERNQLQVARQQLIDYQNRLTKWETDLKQKEEQIHQMQQQAQQFSPNYGNIPPQYQPPQQPYSMQQPYSPNLPNQQNFPMPPTTYPDGSGYTMPKQVLTPPVPQTPKKEGFNFKKIMIGVLVVAIFVALAGIYYKFVILG